MDVLAQRIKKLRELNNYSQKRVADALGISNVQLSRYESGDRKPEPETIKNIADFYDVSVDYLLGRTDVSSLSSEQPYDSLAEITKFVQQLGFTQMGFFNIEEWKNLSPEDVEDIKRHFEFTVHKALERQKKKKN
ncbi:helix-turn-helix domain-containing protein [Ectobacillus antri]|uniref:helix-turn-helix domain-containing protein n=1 Tax=Ectobacillus antri TaxID=2486280 RepID=UPI000F5AEB19|nr:helix-turn-helix transcriptional regulator [Ectobacillus antri]